MKKFFQILFSAPLRLCAKPYVLRATRMTDAELVGALAVDNDHPVLQAVLEVIDRARTEARSEAKAIIKSDRETIFALGGENGLDRLEEYLLNLRAEAMRQRQQG
jgi:hypothetical protein